LVLKYTIWQPRLSPAVVMRSRALWGAAQCDQTFCEKKRPI
jgi:hypothetical protein